MFWSLPDPHPDPLVTSTTDPAPSSSKNSKKTLGFYCFLFCDYIMTLSLKYEGNVHQYSGSGSVGSVNWPARIRIRFLKSEIRIWGAGSVPDTKMSRIRNTVAKTNFYFILAVFWTQKLPFAHLLRHFYNLYYKSASMFLPLQWEHWVGARTSPLLGRGGRWGCCWAWMRFPNRLPPPPPQTACRHHARLAPQKRKTKRAVGNFFCHAGWELWGFLYSELNIWNGTPVAATQTG